jgi:hypothetical protein
MKPVPLFAAKVGQSPLLLLPGSSVYTESPAINSSAVYFGRQRMPAHLAMIILHIDQVAS